MTVDLMYAERHSQTVTRSIQLEIAMKPVGSIVVFAALAASVAACSVQERTYYPRQQYAYAPATTAYYSAPGATVVATTPAPAYYS